MAGAYFASLMADLSTKSFSFFELKIFLKLHLSYNGIFTEKSKSYGEHSSFFNFER
jgi:hypothetical protein